MKNGVVTWRCWCGKRQSRVYGVLPPALLFKSNWPYGIIGCPLCGTIYNAEDYGTRQTGGEMASKTFINELGREITIEVDRGVLEHDGQQQGPFFRYRMIGPDSEIENTVTLMEATVLVELINQESFGGIRIA